MATKKTTKKTTAKKAVTKKSSTKKTVSLKDLGVEETGREESKLFDAKKDNSIAKVLGLFGVVAVCLGIFWLILSSDSPLRSDDAASPGQKTGSQIESQIRDIVDIPDTEKVESTYFINSQNALEDLRSNSANSFFKNASVGDYYLIFENRAVIYSDDGKIVNYLSK